MASNGNGHAALGPRTMARVEGWGMAVDALAHRVFPESAEGIADALALARRKSLPVAFRGAGRSYGDASTRDGGLVVDLSRFNRILAWDPASGIIETEPGVTIEQLWKHIIGDGFWPPVVSGTMFTTMAGCAAMNIHGKNNYCAGPFGEHVLDFDLMLADGSIMTCSREHNAGLFHAAIGGFGMLGCFTRLRLKMKKVHSGLLWVEAFTTPSLDGMIEEFEDRLEDSDYLVGWIDCTAGGRGLGRGVVHQAKYRAPGEDARPADTLNVAAQELPSTLLGVVPKSLMWLPLSFFTNNLGMRCVNTGKYLASRFIAPRGERYLQPHAAFAFLLDYVPGWKNAYRPLAGDARGCGLIQYQSFIPAENAARVHETLVRMARRAGMPSYLGVFKKHRPDAFLMTHALDGYSLALDFKVTARNRRALWALCHQMDEVVLDNGGKFYFAKDATLRAGAVERFIPPANLAAFLALKEQCDPGNLLQTDLSRRLLGERPAAAR
jgi:FAD/FMN-containing dehydrogenase